MANEAKLVVKLQDRLRQCIVADGTGIEKGTILELTDPNTGAASSGTGIFLGIAAAEKVASDGSTKLAIYTEGVFDIKASAATISAGDLVKIDGANLVSTTATAENAIGMALQDAITSEVIEVHVGRF